MGMDLVCRDLFASSQQLYLAAPPGTSILEGLATVLAGVASFWIVQDFPDTAKFLSEEERTVVIRRLQGDDQFSAAGEKLKMKYIWMSFADWKTWVGSMLFSSRSVFILSLIRSFGGSDDLCWL